MKIYVVCDLEGVAGVIDHYQQCQWDVTKGWYAPYLAQARRLATLELNALVEGVLAAGATEAVAWAGHGNFPGGLDVEILTRRVNW
jgi:D-amino peptidase